MATAADLRRVVPLAELRHIEQIEAVSQGETPFSDLAAVSDSWRRCLATRRVDPDSPTAPNVASENELKTFREPLGKEIASAREEIDRLYAIVRQEEYVVLLCNRDGVAIHHRGDASQAERFKQWGIWLGGVWSETIEGTNGIGTCITEERPVLIHRGQHFRTRHTSLTCAGAPIFDPGGRLALVLDVSSMSSGQAHTMALAATKVAAREVEERLFRESFRNAWIIAAAPFDDSHPAILLALDSELAIFGADRTARLAFALNDEKMKSGVALAAIFDFDRSVFRCNREQDIAGCFTSVHSGEWWRVLVTPPPCGPRGWRSPADQATHSRPRISTLHEVPLEEDPLPSRGGLSPARTNRICDFINSNLGQNISLETLAEMAGLSVNHFARAFKQTVGMPPHSFVLQRRIEHARNMLRNTELPVSEIALSVGFSDQSHLARHFRRITGISPSTARWEQT